MKRMQRVRRSPRPRQESMEEALSFHDTEKRSWIRRVPPEVWIFIFYFLVTVFLTWPIIIRFGSSIYGVPSDNLGGLWQLWWLRNFHQYSTSFTSCPLIGFPFGAHGSSVPIEPISFYFEWFLLLFLKEVVVYNIIILMNFVLSGITMYYLVRYLTRDRRVALFGGFAYLISNYIAFNSMYYLHLAMIQWMPLYILMLLRYLKKPGPRTAVYLILSGILVAGTSIHYALFMAIFTAAFLFGRFSAKRISLWREAKRLGLSEKIPWRVNKRTLALSLLVLLVLIVFITPFYYLPLSDLNPAGKWPTSPTPGQLRIEKYIEWNSASPREYIIPSPENPVLGNINKLFGQSRGSFSNALYVGWVLIILAVIGVFVTTRRKRKKNPTGTEPMLNHINEPVQKLSSNENLYITWGLVLAAVVAFMLSMKPYVHIGSTKIPLPSSLLMISVPWFRWYLRMSIIVVICLTILACFGLSRILNKLKGLWKEILLVSLMVILAVEMLLVPPFRYIDLSNVPRVFKKLEALPKGSAIAFYPMNETGLFVTGRLMNFQREFQKPMLNGAYDNSDGEALRRTVFNPYDDATPGILRRFDMNYFVYFKEQMPGAGVKTNEENLPPGLELMEKFEEKGIFRNAEVFKITAPKAELVPLYLGDISIPRMDSDLTTMRVMIFEGIIKILNFGGGDRRVTLRLPISNNTIDREIIIKSGERILFQRKLSRDQEIVADIPDLTIPKKGLDLHLIVHGAPVRLPDDEIVILGTQIGTVKLGDLAIVPL